MNQNLASDTNFTFLVSLSPGLGPLQNITEKNSNRELPEKQKEKSLLYPFTNDGRESGRGYLKITGLLRIRLRSLVLGV